MGLEAAYIDGPGSVHGEYIASRVDRDDGLSTLAFHGGYVQAAWFLTGESLPYLADTGVLGRLRPKSRFTLKNPTGVAWELAVRLSGIDLNDDDIIGGEELNLTLGVTWYLDKYTKVMANYVDVIDVDRPGSEFDGNDLNIFQLRFQIEF
jgi:phosphate-selective porin OprO/OprP